MSETTSRIRMFVLLTAGFSSVFYALIIHAGSLGAGHGMYVTGLMWCPGLAGLITRYRSEGTLANHGWQWGGTRFQVASYLIPLAYAFVVYAVVWITGLGGFYDAEFLHRQSTSFGWTRLPDPVALLLYFVTVGTLGMPGSSASALGEELGWRGFLVPELAKVTTFAHASLISGIVWSMWHYPLLLFADYNAGTAPWYGLLCFTVMVIGISFVFAWMRLASGSVWTGMLLHASHNLFIQDIFDPLTLDTGRTKWIIGEFGAGLAIVGVIMAVVLARRGVTSSTNS
jgi:membrane protease YdiL (CAAX protease family)